MSVWNGHYACTCYHPLFVRRPSLHALAYNLGNFLRTLATPEPILRAVLSGRRPKPAS